MTSVRSLAARAAGMLLNGYWHVAPTGRAGFRLARAVSAIYPPNERRGWFRTPLGIRLRLDLDQYPDCSMAFGLYELDTVRAVRRLLRPGDMFVDGGANIGYFTLLAAMAVGSHGRVHAFEPQPENHARLEEHVRANGMERIVVLHRAALSDRDGETHLHTYLSPEANHGQATLFACPGRETRVSGVPTTRLDTILGPATPRAVKLDIEGAEPLAIGGMGEILRRCRPAVIMELNRVTLASAGFTPREPIDRLLALVPDYRVDVIGWRLKPLRDVERLGEVNLLFR